MLIPKRFLGGEAYQIPYSVMWDRASSSYLEGPVQTTPTDSKKWTFSTWVKRTKLTDSLHPLLSAYDDANNYSGIYFTGADLLRVYTRLAGVADIDISADPKFVDQTAWYHIVVQFDSAQGTAADRLTIWMNNEELTYTTTVAISLNATKFINNSAAVLRLGRMTFASTYYADLIQADTYLIDGQALTPSDFAAADENGRWMPIKYTGTYGSNGRYYNFGNNATAADLGDDSSGNGLDLSTASGLGTDHQFLDTPTNDCAMLPVLEISTDTIAEGGTNLATDGVEYGATSSSFLIPSSGKWYAEFTPSDVTGVTFIGVRNGDRILLVGDYVPKSDADAYAYASDDGDLLTNGVTVAQTGGATYIASDVIGVAVDMDAGTPTCKWYKNNSLQYTQNLTAGVNYAFAISDGSNTTSSTIDANFGHKDFTYTPPAGHLGLIVENLPAPGIADPGLYCQALSYTGTGAENAITGLGFQPDFVWIKGNSTNNHQLFDSVRGATLRLRPDITDAEDTQAQSLKSFDADGFTLGTFAAVNNSGTTFSGVALKEGAVPGLDIIAYTGNGSAGRTVAHNLGVAPAVVITKNRDNGTPNWLVYHHAFAATHYMLLNDSQVLNASTTFLNDTTPDASNVTLGTAGGCNTNTEDYIMYVFAEVEGFSKFGSYEGNGNADGPYVNLGFTPEFVIIKDIDAVQNWSMYSRAKDPYSPTDYVQYPSTNLADGSVAAIHWLANGFKIIDSGNNRNASGDTYIYMAWAKQPLKYARGA